MIHSMPSRPDRMYEHVLRGLPFCFAVAFAGGCVDIRVPDPAVRYVAFGDSSTSGPSMQDYPDILRSLLGEAPETFANEGRSGETSAEGLVRLETLLAGEVYPNAETLLYWESGGDTSDFIKDHDPFLLFSPDDPDYPFSGDLTEQLDETQANIESAVMAAHGAGLNVYVTTYYFLIEGIADCDALPFDIVLPWQAQQANAYLVRLNERIRAAAANQGAFLVDVAAEDDVIRGNADNYFDCNHLSEEGNAIVAEVFFDQITASPRRVRP